MLDSSVHLRFFKQITLSFTTNKTLEMYCPKRVYRIALFRSLCLQNTPLERLFLQVPIQEETANARYFKSETPLRELLAK